MKNKEIDTYRKQQQIKQDEELKAKLAMVELRDKPRWGRPPRKIGEMVCNTGVRGRNVNETTVRFVLRLDSEKGDFVAEHGDFWYVSKSRDALQAKMNEVARVTLDLKWNRYLSVEYKAEVRSDRYYTSTRDIDVETKRQKKYPILGMKLTWSVVEYSQAIRLPGDEDDRYMKRDVDESGKPDEAQETVTSLPPGLVPYSKDREELLKSIRAAFGALDAKMVALFSGSPEQVAKRLDATTGTLLLAAPAKTGKR